MTSGRTFAALLATGLVACAGQPESPAPSATPLAYSLPDRTPLEYTSSDTARINIEVQPGMAMEQTMGQSSHVRLSFAPTVGTAGNLTVTASYLDFSAYAESSMAPREDIDGSGLQGDFVLSVTPRGVVEQVSGPELPEVIEGIPQARMLLGTGRLVRAFVVYGLLTVDGSVDLIGVELDV